MDKKGLLLGAPALLLVHLAILNNFVNVPTLSSSFITWFLTFFIYALLSCSLSSFGVGFSCHSKKINTGEREREKACFIPFCMTFFLNHFFLFGHSILSCFFFPFLFVYITSIVFSQSNAFIHDFLYDFCL